MHKLGDINKHLGFTMTEEFVESLGISKDGNEKRAVLYTEESLNALYDRLISRIENMREQQVVKQPPVKPAKKAADPKPPASKKAGKKPVAAPVVDDLDDDDEEL